MAIYDRFNEFMRNLELTKLQREDVAIKRHNVGNVLHSAYYATRYDGRTNFLGGSHGKGTAIRPPSDIDLMFVVPYDTYRAFEQRIGNKQSQLLQQVRQSLISAFPNTEIRADGQVVVVPFSSYRVEVVPCIRLQSGAYWICDSNDGGRWRTTHPDAEAQALDASDRLTKGNSRTLIKMMKTWRRHCNVPIKPLALELLAIEFLNNWGYRSESNVYHDWMVRDFFAFLIKRKNTSVMVPGLAEVISLGSEWLSRAESANARADAACIYETSKLDSSASIEWKKIFGDMYPSPVTSAASLLYGRGTYGG